MNSNVKIAVGLAAVVLAVSGVTIIMSYTPQVEKPIANSGGATTTVEMVEPLRYSGTREVYYLPRSVYREQREFPGFFEVNDREHTATFWLQNINPVPVEIAAINRSCSACTSARIATFPASRPSADVVSAAQALLGVAGEQTVEPAKRDFRVRSLPSDEWQLLDFDHPEKLKTIPAGSEETPTWVALQLNFKVRQKGLKLLSATLGIKTVEQTTMVHSEYKIGFIGVARYDVVPAQSTSALQIDFREMPETTASKTEDFIYFSSTVPQKELAPPKCTEDPFLTYSKPQPMTDAEIEQFIARVSKPEAPLRVTVAYRVSVTLHRKNPNPKPGVPPELDIGPLEKSIGVCAADNNNADPIPQIAVKANVTGLVSLAQGSSLDLGTFSSRDGVAKPFALRSDRLDLELEVSDELTEPKVIKAILEAPTNADGRRYWNLKIRIAAGATAQSLPNDSVVVLRDKATGQLVRLPVKGQALLR